MRRLGPLLAASVLLAQAQSATTLPGATPWDFPAGIVAEQYAELRGFYERYFEKDLVPQREAFARRPPAEQRALLRELTGAIDTPMTPAPVRTALGSTSSYAASLVTWPLLRMGTQPPTRGSAGTLVRCYGILLEPHGSATRAALIVVPDANQSAADLAGLTGRLTAESRRPQFLAQAGYVVFVPFFTQRRAFSQPWLEDRMWLQRLAYQTGRHIIGAELLQIQSIVTFLQTLTHVDPKRIGIAGSGQGGLTALFAAALDERLRAAVSEGYRDDPLPEWEQPEDRMMWKLRAYLSNDAIAQLAAPRLRGSIELMHHALTPSATTGAGAGPAPSMDLEKVSEIANAQFSQWQAFFRNAALEAADSLQTRWRPDFSSPAAYTKSLASKQAAYRDMIGHYPPATGPLDVRSVRIYDEPGFEGHRCSIRVYDGVHAYGILLVPKGMKPGERRPVVLVQHGLGGRPESSLGVEANEKDDAVYSRFGLALARRGYIVFAPMIATQDNAERTRLIRRGHPIGLIPAGMDVRKFGRVLDYLSTLPYVDASRFAFYGLSYGGYTALWTGPGEPRFRAVISSGHFNDWNVKTTDLTQGTAYPFYFNVFDQYNFGMLGQFNHSDLASLIAPRAFLVEMGDQDGVIVAPRSLVDRELDKVLEVYRKLGIPDQGQVARFPGPHKIDGREAYAFLDRVLQWTPGEDKRR
ncbi:MAG TPA: prolyl oligopeptidase family serine peptidase [Bryobacteraceae bacterium]|nr:prolyl oligopeptidase family serine peptidase [Bryobacteraceae bacterium]